MEEGKSGIVSRGGTNTVLAEPDFDFISLEEVLLSERMVRMDGAGERERAEGSGKVTARLSASLNLECKLLMYHNEIQMTNQIAPTHLTLSLALSAPRRSTPSGYKS